VLSRWEIDGARALEDHLTKTNASARDRRVGNRLKDLVISRLFENNE